MMDTSVFWCACMAMYLLDLAPRTVAAVELERHPNDGWYNNLQHPAWGAADTQLLRRAPSNYSDGVYQPSGPSRPNALDISTIAFKGDNELSSARNRNALLVYFGQQLVEEIVDAQRPGCPREYFNIRVPKDHKYNVHKNERLEMPFLRARYDQRTGYLPSNPRQQLNEVTPYLDGNLVYGTGKAVEDALREFKDGRLLVEGGTRDPRDSFPPRNDIRLPFANPPSPRDHVLRPVSRFRRFGNPRTHENPFLTALALIWFRYHNKIAGDIKAKNPNLNDEGIFNAARKRVIAQYQKITMYEWLPAFLAIDQRGQTFDMDMYPYHGGRKNMYRGYDPNIHPGISTEFQAAAMRFGHTLVPSGVLTMAITAGYCHSSTRPVQAKYTSHLRSNDTDVPVTGIRLCNSYWLPRDTLGGEPSVDAVVRGLIYTRAAREDNVIVSDLREDVFGPLEWSRRDLGALNIQRGRDLGLSGYNDVRKAYGLNKVRRWDDISSNRQYIQVLRRLSQLYNSSSPDDLDLFPGGLLETTHDGPGSLFQAIILDQFLRIRHGDRFWYENKANGLFTNEEIKDIDDTTFYDVIKSVTHVLDDDLLTPKQKNTFVCEDSQTIPGCKCADFLVESSPVHETCEPLRHYDYFSGSEASFCITICIILISVPVTIGVMMKLSEQRKKGLNTASSTPKVFAERGPNHFYATEWVGRSAYGLLNSRDTKIVLDHKRMKIFVSNMQGRVVRMIDLRRRIKDVENKPRAALTRSSDKGYKLMVLAVPGEVDLVLHFPTQHEREGAVDTLKNLFENLDWSFHESHAMAEHVIWREAYTVDERKTILAKFFKRIVNELADEGCSKKECDELTKEDVLQTKLTRTEFADALDLQPESLFVRNMFLLVDTTGDGFVSFDEFKNYFGILSSGSPEQKAHLFFKMFDTQRTGQLSKDNYKIMLQSLLELNEVEQTQSVDVRAMTDTMFQRLGKGNEDFLTFQDFKQIMFSESADLWKSAFLQLSNQPDQCTSAVPPKRLTRSISVKDRTQSFVRSYTFKHSGRQTSYMRSPLMRQARVVSKTVEAPKSEIERLLKKWTRYADNRRQHIFWLSLYTLVTLAIFAERFYYFTAEREHKGLRRVTGLGVSVTRGAASAQMFTLATLLLTMSRNTITYFRETFLHQFIPFDSAHDMHVYVAGLTMFFTIVHVFGHVCNLYHISYHASSDLNCYFREYFRSTHVLASFQYWTYCTITGLTGLALTFLMVILYVFSTRYARRHAFKYFRTAHNLYIAIFILLFMHGAARMVLPPLWPYFVVGPLILFVCDKLISVSRIKVLLPVIKVTSLPSGVINLIIKRPLTFNYQSGQWVRIACPVLGKGEYHPFTLTSAPNEEHLSLHIRAVGPWTNNLRQVFNSNVLGKNKLPMLYVDGPFGESHQDWYRYPVSVLLGAGIGVTPFASILKDIAHMSKAVNRLRCQKVYFLWVTRTQRNFEWMTDIIRQMETADRDEFVDVHICITQMKEKFDLRTTMLYICERHFQKIAGLSMFTGLRAKTHFGRPKFGAFFRDLKDVHSQVEQIGVFSCGPSSMNRSIALACTEVNAYTGPSLIHYFENF